MLTYKCYNITLDDGSLLQDEYGVSVPEVDLSDPLDRADHIVAISGALENVMGRYVDSFSYMKAEHAS